MTTTETIALLKNVAAFMALAETIRSRPAHMDGIGAFYGPTGYGKTQSAIYVQTKMGARFIRVGETWTKSTLLKKILAEAEVRPHGTISDMVDQVVIALGDEPTRPLIIDEADRLMRGGLIELVREIHDLSQAPILLVGEERLSIELELKSERTHGRVISWVPAQPCDAEDTAALARLFCPDLKIGESLLAEVQRRSGGRARLITSNLNSVRECARAKGLRSIGGDQFDGEWFTGAAPQRSGAVPTRRTA